MNREQKTTYVNDLKTVIAANEGILVYHYEGITVKDLESLRAKMRESGAFLKITKNRIAKIALKGSKAEKLEKTQDKYKCQNRKAKKLPIKKFYK